MAYDTEVADRIRECLQDAEGLSEKTMFGGLAFLLGGNMAVAASSQRALMVRCDRAQTDALVERAEARRMVMKDRELDGWLHVDVDGLSDEVFAGWVDVGRAYAAALPPK